MGTFLKVGVAAVPVPLPVSSVAGGPAASPSREPKPVPLFLHPSPTLAEDKVTSAQQPQATSQGSPSPGGTLPPAEANLYIVMQSRSFLVVYSRTETWLHLCISKRHITMYFSKQESLWLLSALRWLRL